MFVKEHSGMTRRLMRRLQQSGGQRSFLVLLEGPYGVPLNLSQFGEVVLVAGGIGITAILSHIHSQPRNIKISLHWAVRHYDMLAGFQDEIDLLSSMNVEVSVYVTDEVPDLQSEKSVEKDFVPSVFTKSSSIRDLSYGRPDLSGLAQTAVSQATTSIAFYTCGPRTMNHDMRNAVSANLSKTKYYVQYYEEGFAI